MRRLPAISISLLLVAVAIPFLTQVLGSTVEPSPSVAPSATPVAQATPAVTPSPTPDPTPTPIPVVAVPIVPVSHFRTNRDRSTLDEVHQILAGSSEVYDVLVLVTGDRDAVLAAFGVDPAEADDAAAAGRLVDVATPEDLAAALVDERTRLGFLRAGDVTPAVRALSWGRDALFGVGRVEDLAAWPLTIEVPEPDAGPPAEAFDPAAAWTLVAGGDIMLDRGVHETLIVKGRGADFAFDGGTAEITSRYCCSSFGWELPRTERTGDEGAMRTLVHGADLAIANFENPAPDDPRWHTSGTVFSAEPSLIEGLANAGIDWVSLANNHIRDAGGDGIVQTIDNLDRYGIASGGAGADLAAAAAPSMLEANGVSVALLGFDSIAGYYAADVDRAGSAVMNTPALKAGIAAAKEAGADVIIVFPHWGTEYDATPFERQRKLAEIAIEEGADMVIGNHAHWAGAMEVIAGRPIWYALGNFVFDQTWSEPTMEGITLELTFEGDDLVQARMRPHIILDKAQPNFLDPAGDGRVVMGQIYDASRDLLPW